MKSIMELKSCNAKSWSSETTPLITVAICTWNRADLLDQTLTAMRSLRIPDDTSWEVLVVDNNSTDDTADVILRHVDKLPLRAVVETRQGTSHARNRAICEARGQLLFFTDDDVRVAPDWIEAYLQAAAAYPTAAFFGGTVLPMYECEPPHWLRTNLDKFGKVLAIRRMGDGVRPLGEAEIVITANTAFRMRALREYRYDPQLSRVGASIGACEDHELIARMRADGHAGVWVGTAIVEHFIPRQRMTLQFAKQWWREQAQMFLRRFPEHVPERGRVPRWLWVKYTKASGREVLLRMQRGPAWAEAFFEAAWLRGLMDGCLACGAHAQGSKLEQVAEKL